MSLQIGGRVGLPEAGLMLDIAPHRPDIRAALQEAAAEAADIGGGGDVGVYAAGVPAADARLQEAMSCCIQDGRFSAQQDARWLGTVLSSARRSC